MTNDNAPDTAKRDCNHGQLARQCNICELEQALDAAHARIAELEEHEPHFQAIRDDLMQANKELRAEVEALRKTISEIKAISQSWIDLFNRHDGNSYGHLAVKNLCLFAERMNDPEGDQVLREEVEWRKREDIETERREKGNG